MGKVININQWRRAVAYEFNYAIRFPNGTYYTGRVNSEAEPSAWQGKKHEAFTYTIEGAYNKVSKGGCFKNCSIVHII